MRRASHPLCFLIAGWAFGVVAVIGELSGVLIAAGLLITVGGVLLAFDNGASVDWMMRIFWREQFGRIHILEGGLGRAQMRGIGGVAALVGLAFAAAGIARVLNIGSFG